MATSNTTLGTKYNCFMCQCKFYDLNRPDPLCPRCGANQKAQPKPKAASSRSRAADRVREEVYVPPIEEEEEVAPADAVPTDTDLLGEEADSEEADED